VTCTAIVSPDTILRWHRDLIRRRHANASRRMEPGSPRTRRTIESLTLRLARETPSCGYRRVHGELATLGITVAASTVWDILKRHGIEPAPQRDCQTWAGFLSSQAHAILSCDFFRATALNGMTYFPRMNSIMDCWVQTCRYELLDRTLIWIRTT
jgi:transposase